MGGSSEYIHMPRRFEIRVGGLRSINSAAGGP